MTDAPFTPTEPVAEPITTDVPERQTIVARFDDVTMADIRTIMDTGFSAVGQVLQELGVQPVGGAFSKYDGDPSQTFSIELGFPVAEALDEPRNVRDVVVIPSSLPAGRVATVSHVGGYEALGEAWGSFMAWLRQQDVTLGQGFWEVYVTEPDPEADPATVRTDLVVPLAS